MRIPINTELQHIAPGYDPTKAHAYYEKHKKLKGRKAGAAQSPAAKTRVSPVKAQQKVALQHSISNLEGQLGKLEQLIKEKETLQHMTQAQAKVKVRKEKPKTKIAAENAKIARENKKYSAQPKSKRSEVPLSNLKALATKVKGQLAVAKQKLAAL